MILADVSNLNTQLGRWSRGFMERHGVAYIHETLVRLRLSNFQAPLKLFLCFAALPTIYLSCPITGLRFHLWILLTWKYLVSVYIISDGKEVHPKQAVSGSQWAMGLHEGIVS